jgi:hypothetical protein
MVTRILLLLGALTAVLAVACGGGDNSSSASTATQLPALSAAPTSTPQGAYAIVEPREGPPGTEITVTGHNWEPGVLVDITGALDPGVTGNPYKTVTSSSDGSFTAQFRLESKADGTDLSTGRYDLIASSASTKVTIPFLVETRHPITGSGPTG